MARTPKNEKEEKALEYWHGGLPKAAMRELIRAGYSTEQRQVFLRTVVRTSDRLAEHWASWTEQSDW